MSVPFLPGVPDVPGESSSPSSPFGPEWNRRVCELSRSHLKQCIVWVCTMSEYVLLFALSSGQPGSPGYNGTDGEPGIPGPKGDPGMYVIKYLICTQVCTNVYSK